MDSGVLVDTGSVSEGVGEADWNESWGVTGELSLVAGMVVGADVDVGPVSAPQANAKPRTRLEIKKPRIIQKHPRFQRLSRDPARLTRGVAECSRAG